MGRAERTRQKARVFEPGQQSQIEDDGPDQSGLRGASLCLALGDAPAADIVERDGEEHQQQIHRLAPAIEHQAAQQQHRVAEAARRQIVQRKDGGQEEKQKNVA